jgi:DNA polymerase III epsilon subunit-like protein
MKECYISVDIETSGPIVGQHSMLSLGACLVDDMNQQFTAMLRPISDLVVPEAIAIVGHDLDYFRSHGLEPREGMSKFREWIHATIDNGTPIFVAFNAPFDWSFVNWYFLTFLSENPFGVSALDIKAYYAGLSGVSWEETRSSRLPENLKSKREHTHDALEDAIEQAEIFRKIQEKAGSRNPSEARRREDIKKRERAANLQATQHASLRDMYGTSSIIVTVSALLLTSLIIALSLASDQVAFEAFRMSPIEFKLVTAGIALLAFSLVLVQLVWRPDSRHYGHKAAVNHYTNAKFEFRKLLKQTHISDTDVAIAEAKYLDVRDLPPVPERWFLPLKQWHEKKLAMSRRLNDDPNSKR